MKRTLLICLGIIVLFATPAFSGDKWPASEIVEKCDEYFLKSIDPSYLRILRNSIFATYGRSFNSADLKNLFAAKDWYKENPDYNDDLLSDDEKACAEKIKRIEDELLDKMDAVRGKDRVAKTEMIPNLDLFGELDDKSKKLLLENGFVLSPTKEEQLFYIYEKNSYRRIPSFVSTDSLLQLYHVFFDFSLRRIEEKSLLPILETLVRAMYEESVALAPEDSPEKIRRAALTNAAYFAVACKLLEIDISVDKLPPDLSEAVEGELASIKARKSRGKSMLFPYMIDYTQFIPRGHYTRSDELTRYFLGMMWLGNTLFAFEPSPGLLTKEEADKLLLQSILITHVLYNSKSEEKPLKDLWNSIYNISAFYVGIADDLSPSDMKLIMDEIYGADGNTGAYLDDEKLQLVRARAKEEWRSEIIPQLMGIPNTVQMRFMGQRYIPDSEMLQKLTKWPERAFPKGLDIMAVLSSETAEKILTEFYKEQETWPDYPARLEQLKEKFSELSPDEWRQNMYYGWLWCLQALIKGRIEGKVVPYFSTTEAWRKKNLNTALASWTELRHDTILYAKQGGAEGGDFEDYYVIPPPPKGYVEPNVEFYERLEILTELSLEGLERFDLLGENRLSYFRLQVNSKYGGILPLISFLKAVAEKELQGEPLSNEEYSRINSIGSYFEQATSLCMEAYKWYLLEERERFMALVADVHTSERSVLEEGVGYANEILAIAPIEGVLYLTRGPVFSYYEFKHPADDRLTDEKWQKMLKDGNAPERPGWLDDIFVDVYRKLPEGKIIPARH